MHAVGRPSWGSSFLGDPDAKFLCGKRERGTKKEKSSKKERKEGLWKLTLLMEIRKERGFPQQLEKSLAKNARLFHSSHRPNNKDLSIINCRQRSTLRRPNIGPKDGEHLSFPESKITAPVLGWLEDWVIRSDNRDFGVAESFSTCADIWIVW